MKQIALIYEDDRLLNKLDPNDPQKNCSGYKAQATSEMCGGCDGCMLMLAVYYGMKIIWRSEDAS